MFRNLKKISPGGAIILMLVFINAIILKYSLTGEMNFYWLLFISVPLLIAAIMLMKYDLFFAGDINNISLRNEVDTVPFYHRDSKEQNDVADIQAHHGWPGYHWQSFPAITDRSKKADLRVTVGNDQCLQPYSASILNINGKYCDEISDALNIHSRESNFAQNTGEFSIQPTVQNGGDLIWQMGEGYSKCCDEKGDFDLAKFKAEAHRPQVKMIELNLSAFVGQKNSTAFSSAEGMLLFLQSLRDASSGKPVGFRCMINGEKGFCEICYSMHKTGIVPDFITIEDGKNFNHDEKGLFKNQVMPLFEAIGFVSKTIGQYGLKQRIKIFVFGEFRNGFEIFKALSMGADGCFDSGVMMPEPDRIQVLEAESKIDISKPMHSRFELPEVAKVKFRVANFHDEIIQETRELMEAYGFARLDEISVAGFLRKLRAPGLFNGKQPVLSYRKKIV